VPVVFQTLFTSKKTRSLHIAVSRFSSSIGLTVANRDRLRGLFVRRDYPRRPDNPLPVQAAYAMPRIFCNTGGIDAKIRKTRFFNFNSRNTRALREKERVYIYAYLYIFMKTQSRENEAKSSANKKKCIFPSSFCPLLPFSVSSVRALLLPLPPPPSCHSRASAASKNRNARRFCGGNFCPRQRVLVSGRAFLG